MQKFSQITLYDGSLCMGDLHLQRKVRFFLHLVSPTLVLPENLQKNKTAQLAYSADVHENALWNTLNGFVRNHFKLCLYGGQNIGPHSFWGTAPPNSMLY